LKHGIYSPFLFSIQNAVCFIILTYLVPVLFTFYIQGVLKLKNNSGARRLNVVPGALVLFWAHKEACHSLGTSVVLLIEVEEDHNQASVEARHSIIGKIQM